MKRSAGAIAIILLVLIGALAFSKLYPTYTYRYRLTVSIEVDGQSQTGSSVIEVSWVGQPNIPGAGSFQPHVRGQAVYVGIGPHSAVVAVLNAPSHDEGGIMRWPYGVNALFLAARAFGNESTNKVLPELVRLRGRRDLTADNMPALIWFSDITDAKTARRIKSSEIKSILGPSAKIAGNVEITGDPIVIDIDRKLPWYADLAKRQKAHGVSARPGEFVLVHTTFIGDGP